MSRDPILVARHDVRVDNDYMRQHMLDRYHRRRAAAIEQLGGKCVTCGSVDGLDFDHVDRSTKAFNIGKAFASMNEVGLQVELAKCQLLCHPCHIKKSRTDGVPHGGGKAGKWVTVNGERKHCPCGPCRQAYRTYMNAYKRSRR